MIPGSSEMRICVVILGLCLAALRPPIDAHAQNSSSGGWMIPDWNKPPITDANRKPAPRRSLAGTWGPVEGGVQIGSDLREQRFFGYSVGSWVDDYTLEVQTVGTMPEDRVWLDSTGRPISDRVRVTETFRRVDYDTLVWSETLEDPKVYSKPWETMRLPMRLHDPRTDVMEYYCSPVEQDNYNKRFGNAAGGKEAR